MTENQTKEVFKLLTRCVSGIQRLESDVDVIKQDVSELKAGQSKLDQGFGRLEDRQSNLEERQDTLEEGQQSIVSELRVNNRILSEVVNEQARLGARVTILEERTG
ncbi:MAG TPA: hypothetical protein VMM38_07420 [Aridibacter sp.]|nr:hypothetical protein [Aridibacter sp.]